MVVEAVEFELVPVGSSVHRVLLTSSRVEKKTCSQHAALCQSLLSLLEVIFLELTAERDARSTRSVSE